MHMPSGPADPTDQIPAEDVSASEVECSRGEKLADKESDREGGRGRRSRGWGAEAGAREA